MGEIMQIWASCRGLTPWRKDPTLQRRSTPRRGMAFHAAVWPSGEFGQPRVRRCVAKLRRSVAVLPRGLATVHSMENCCVLVLSCYSVAPRTCLLD